MCTKCFPVGPAALVLLTSMVASAQPTLIERSLHALKQSPPAAADSFDFIVVGDSNTLKPLEQSKIFRQSIREFNILKPNFVLEVGDIILGGAAEGVPAQWDLFEEVIAACEPPYLPLPGNHDISDTATEKIWLDRIGPTHYTFEYGNSLFILLNSEEVGAKDRISDAQTIWLNEQLDSATATNIFVFLHKPYFEHTGDPDTLPERWKKQWNNIAQAFQGHPVRAVFAGHWHGYRDCGIREGVHYAITGGASTYGMRDPQEEGSFNHYLHVRVRGEEISWAVIKPYSVLPENAVTSDRIGELHNIRHKWIAAKELFSPWGQPVDQEAVIAIHNPHDQPLKSSITWQTESGWSVTPQKSAYQIPPGERIRLNFRARAARPADARWPVPVFHTRYEGTQYGPPVDVEQDLKLVPTLSAHRAPKQIKIDGMLSDWQSVQMVPLQYPVAFNPEDKDDLQCQLGFLWDAAHLFMAVETTDNEFHQPYAGDIVWSADNVEVFIDGWSWGLSLTEKGPEVFLYWGVDVSAETINADVQLAVKRNGAKITYEAAFPASHLKPLTLSPGSSFRFNGIMNDLDPSGPIEARHWLELLPGAGSLGARAPRVMVVLGE